MKSTTLRTSREGFTLIEILVALILLALLAAAVFPVVTQQIEKGDPARAANDLANIRTGIETFQLNVRPSFPGDLEDLAFRVSSTADRGIAGTGDLYTTTQVSKWDGPYIDAALVEEGQATLTDVALESGFGGQILRDLTCFNGTPAINADTGTTCAASTHFVSIQITGLSNSQFEEINDLIDGENEADATSEDTGKLRIGDLDADNSLDTNEKVYYLAVPYRGS